MKCRSKPQYLPDQIKEMFKNRLTQLDFERNKYSEEFFRICHDNGLSQSDIDILLCTLINQMNLARFKQSSAVMHSYHQQVEDLQQARVPDINEIIAVRRHLF